MTSPLFEYYHYENRACRVERRENNSKIAAETYFPGSGFVPTATLPVLWYGDLITEKAFKEIIAAQLLAYRKGRPV